MEAHTKTCMVLLVILALILRSALVDCAGTYKSCRGPKRTFKHGRGVNFQTPCVRLECYNGKFIRMNCTNPPPKGSCMNRHRGPWPTCCKYFRLC
uniref:Single domain-containing protein n=1 Tax=Amblyomma triste TaxID=251400 RepID=A0A023G6N1_AMBTT